MADSLDGIPLFADMTESQRATLVRAMVDVQLTPGHVLFQEGKVAGGSVGLYVLREGSLTVSVKRPSGGFAVIRSLSPGEVVGVIGLINPDHVRRGTVVAGSAARVSHLSRQAFLALVAEGSTLSCAFQLAIARQLVHDLRRVDEALRDALHKEAGVPLGNVHVG